jgi:peptidoglycan hydrolase-like protein with peptidoglycan-binding domain
MRRRGLIAGVAGATAIAGVLAVALRPGGSSASPPDKPPPAATATVTRATLTETESLDGTLGYSGAASVVGQRPGTITALAAEGATVDRGQTLYEVDGRSIPLLFGTRPMWRALDETVADGADVRELEENLVALGYGGGFRVDDTYTSDTTAAVKRWQKARGVDQTGRVEVGDAVYLPGAVRVTSRTAKVGGRAEGDILAVTSTARAVTVDLAASRQHLVKVKDAVTVELPDGNSVAGTIASIGAVATAGNNDSPDGGSEPTVTVTITLAEAPAGLDQAPVAVHVTRNKADHVLTVPVSALLANPSGGYVVEVVQGGQRHRVAVETGVFADGRVEVTGRLTEGQKVTVPA